jgi:hypothetical protein
MKKPQRRAEALSEDLDEGLLGKQFSSIYITPLRAPHQARSHATMRARAVTLMQGDAP